MHRVCTPRERESKTKRTNERTSERINERENERNKIKAH